MYLRNGCPYPIKAHRLHRRDHNLDERILLCIWTALVWESEGLLHKMCIGVERFEVRLVLYLVQHFLKLCSIQFCRSNPVPSSNHEI